MSNAEVAVAPILSTQSREPERRTPIQHLPLNSQALDRTAIGRNIEIAQIRKAQQVAFTGTVKARPWRAVRENPLLKWRQRKRSLQPDGFATKNNVQQTTPSNEQHGKFRFLIFSIKFTKTKCHA